MLTIAIDCGDQRRNGHAALAGDLLQTVPELVFNADAGLVACNDNRALRNRRLQASPPQMNHGTIIGRLALRARPSILANEANSLNLWPQQHSQQRLLRLSWASLSGGFGGNDRCG